MILEAGNEKKAEKEDEKAREDERDGGEESERESKNGRKRPPPKIWISKSASMEHDLD